MYIVPEPIPKDCNNCYFIFNAGCFNDHEVYYCNVCDEAHAKEELAFSGKRPKWCPLKELKPAKVKTISRKGEYPEIVHRCGKCKQVILRYHKFCPYCERQVKWE